MTLTDSCADEPLMLQISKGDENAFQQLFYQYKDKLYAFAFRLTESNETAEDIVHDTFLKLWLNKEKLSEVKNVNAYIYKAAHNHICNAFRRKAKETLILAELKKELSIEVDDTDNRILLNEAQLLIDNAIDKLTPQQREVFKMSRKEGLKTEEIAQRLNISLFTVKKHLTNALNYLRKEVANSYRLEVMLFALYMLRR